MKRIIGVILALILVSMPFTSSVMTIEKEADDEHPEYYNVTRYDLRGFTYSEETIKVSYEDAMAIKDAFDGIDSSFGDDKFERKANVIKSYGLIPRSIKSIQSKEMNHKYQQFDSLLIFSRIEGFIGPSIINEINFFVFAPIFTATALGANLRLESFISPDITEFNSNRIVNIFLVGFLGVLIVFPFISPGGYVNGITFFGQLTEY